MKELYQEIKIWEAQVISEIGGGNLVKENFARGKVAGLRAALAIIEEESHDDCAGCEHASDKQTYDCMAPSLTPCPNEQTKKGDN